MIVRKILPAISVGRIIFTDCRPLPLGEVRPPAFPVTYARGVLSQTLFLHGLTAQGFWIHAFLVEVMRNSLRGSDGARGRWQNSKGPALIRYCGVQYTDRIGESFSLH